MSNPIKHVFFDVNMANQHEGLARMALGEQRIEVSQLRVGDMIIFLNKARNRIKILAGTSEDNGRGLIAYYRSPKGTIDLRMIAEIPSYFSGGSIDFSRAIRKTLLDRGIKEAK